MPTLQLPSIRRTASRLIYLILKVRAPYRRFALRAKLPYGLEVCRYVVLNPVRAKMVVRAEDWAWSSYRAMVVHYLR